MKKPPPSRTKDYRFGDKRARLKVGGILFATVIAATAILIIANFEDCMYFALGAESFPANNVQWTWMEQYKLWGSWTTPDQIVWTSVFLLVLAAFLAAIMKYSKRYT